MPGTPRCTPAFRVGFHLIKFRFGFIQLSRLRGNDLTFRVSFGSVSFSLDLVSSFEGLRLDVSIQAARLRVAKNARHPALHTWFALWVVGVGVEGYGGWGLKVSLGVGV